MALEELNVNEVYTTVLAILNKEQRGYMTPYEFNKIATQVQLEIFESYFTSLSLALKQPMNSDLYANNVKILNQKISRFETEQTITISAAGEGDLASLSPDLYKLGTVYFINGSLLPVEIEQVTRRSFGLVNRSQLTAPSESYPIYYKEGNKIKIAPKIASVVAPANGAPEKTYTVEYIKKPKEVVWNYSIGAVGQYVHNPAAPNQNFEISPQDEAEVILKILKYAGIVIRDPEIIQTAAQSAAAIDQQQMQ
jgi:hypothetical protein